jgi:hypothetical protein
MAFNEGQLNDRASVVAAYTASIMIGAAVFYAAFGTATLAGYSVYFMANGTFVIGLTGTKSSFAYTISLPLTSAYENQTAFLAAVTTALNAL